MEGTQENVDETPYKEMGKETRDFFKTQSTTSSSSIKAELSTDEVDTSTSDDNDDNADFKYTADM